MIPVLKRGDRVKDSAEGLKLFTPRRPGRLGVVASIAAGGKVRVLWDGNKHPDSRGRPAAYLEAVPKKAEPSVQDISDEDLLRRAVRNARDRRIRKGHAHPRWAAVMDSFALRSTFAQQLCRRFGLDPDELVKS